MVNGFFMNNSQGGEFFKWLKSLVTNYQRFFCAFLRLSALRAQGLPSKRIPNSQAIYEAKIQVNGALFMAMIERKKSEKQKKEEIFFHHYSPFIF